MTEARNLSAAAQRTQLPPHAERSHASPGGRGPAPIYAPRIGGPGQGRGDVKRLSTLIARAALAGVTVHRIESDFGGVEFIATKWALTKSFSSLDALESWVDKVVGQGVRARA